MIEQIYNDLQNGLASLRRDMREISQNSDVVGAAYGFPVSTLANAPLAADGQITYAVRFISDARKSGEGVGLGTGLPAFYDPASDSWLDFTGVGITT